MMESLKKLLIKRFAKENEQQKQWVWNITRKNQIKMKFFIKKIIPKKGRRWLRLNLTSRDAIKKKNTKPCKKKSIIRIMTEFYIGIKMN